MKKLTRTAAAAMFMAAAALFLLCLSAGHGRSGALAGEGPDGKPPEGGDAQQGAVKAVEPKPLGDAVKKGLDWLAKTQNPDGGWAQGEESSAMGHGMEGVRDVSNVGDTCMAILAMLRAGYRPGDGEWGERMMKGVAFVCGQIEESDQDSLFVTSVRNTRIQMKIGTFVDTFLAAQVLSEVKGRTNGKDSDAKVLAALEKVVRKLEKNQQANGTWDNRGWAPVLGQSLATRALNYAVQKGISVNEEVRKKAETYSRGQLNGDGSFRADGAAGVGLYAAAGNLAGMQNSDNTNAAKAKEAEEKLKEAKTEEARAAAKDEIARYRDNRQDLEKAQGAIASKVGDEAFVRGFGSNGGEEFLSYMHISESLVVKGGKAWTDWDKAMTDNLGRIQNQDGSWSGHHCITGRTFCTAAALMVLMADRTEVPVEVKAGSKAGEEK